MDNRTRNSDLLRRINKPNTLSFKAPDAPKQSLLVKRTISEDCTGVPDTNRPHKYHCLRKEAQRHGTAHLDHLIGRDRPRRSRDIPPAHNAQQADQKMAPGSSTFKPKQCQWEGCTSRTLFRRENDLLRHLRTIHIAPSAFRCLDCSKAFGRKDHLQNHRRKIHGY
ncbi:hypothetical protein BJY01DRAFT_14478 [Aspergillus pseudoustus]|uniref:C2H2-type domain-containing protein n=1 Tax=Aspergillus pseudoustus TaxID=1810923 RepID=A0ABR4JPY8_9EURO